MNPSAFTQWGSGLSPTARGGLFYLGLSGASATFLPFINVFYANRGLSGREIGLLVAAGPVVALLAAPLLVALADRRGWQVQMMVSGLGGVALTTLLIPLVQPFAVLLAVVVTLGLLGSTVGSISDGTIAQMAVRHRINYGKMRLWGSAGWVAMSLLGGFLWPIFGLWLMFPMASLLFVATIFAARLLGESRSGISSERKPLRLTSGTGRFWVILTCALFANLALIMARNFSAIYIAHLSGELLVGLYAAVAAAIEIPVILWTEKVMHRVGGPSTLLISHVLIASAFIGLAVLPTPQLFLFAAMAEGTGYGLFITATVRLSTAWSPPGQISTYQGLLNAGTAGLAPLVAGLLGGTLYDAFGPPTVFITSAGSAALAFALLFVAQLRGLFPKAPEQAAAQTAAPTPAVD